MTATIRPGTNGHRRPVLIEVQRHEIVGELMDWQTYATEAIEANGAALELVLRLPAGPWREELKHAHEFAHDSLTTLRDALRDATSQYDRTPARA